MIATLRSIAAHENRQYSLVFARLDLTKILTKSMNEQYLMQHEHSHVVPCHVWVCTPVFVGLLLTRLSFTFRVLLSTSTASNYDSVSAYGSTCANTEEHTGEAGYRRRY